ncbi:MAG: 50S ribosomal protein L22 [Deltaproteobacteria bacterium]|nr:50S ribosomal protein L22 [Deltaproteobacteria bacterium]
MATTGKATFSHVRMAPTKVRVVANLVRGKRVETAMELLQFCTRRAAGPVLKLLKSALANADQRGGVDVDRLYVRTLTVNEGPRLKRSRPRSRGMAHPIVKASSHLQIELGER